MRLYNVFHTPWTTVGTGKTDVDVELSQDDFGFGLTS